MPVNTNDALANKRLDCTFNGAAGVSIADNGKIEFRTGARPATADTAATGTIVATVNLPADAAAAAATRSVSLQGTLQDLSADNGGTIGWARLTSGVGPGTYVVDFTVTATGGGGDITVDNPTLVQGQQFNVTSLAFTE